MGSLDQLRKSLLFNSLVDVWVAFSEERGSDWFDPDGFAAFVRYLRHSGVNVRRLPVCPTVPGKKAFLVEAATKNLGERAEALIVRLDDEVVAAVRAFQKQETPDVSPKKPDRTNNAISSPPT